MDLAAAAAATGNLLCCASRHFCSCKDAVPVCLLPWLVSPLQGQQSNTRGGPFAVLNGSMVADVLVVALPAGAKLQQPLHVLHVSTPAAAAADASSSGPALNASAARLLVSLGANASCEVVEEFVSDAEGSHVTMPVAEVVLGQGSELKHGYVHREASGAQHFKATLVKQVGCGLRGSLQGARSAACLTAQSLCVHMQARSCASEWLLECWRRTRGSGPDGPGTLLLLCVKPACRLRAAAMSLLRRAWAAA